MGTLMDHGEYSDAPSKVQLPSPLGFKLIRLFEVCWPRNNRERMTRSESRADDLLM